MLIDDIVIQEKGGNIQYGYRNRTISALCKQVGGKVLHTYKQFPKDLRAKRVYLFVDAVFPPVLSLDDTLFALNPDKLILIIIDNTIGLDRQAHYAEFLKERGCDVVSGFPLEQVKGHTYEKYVNRVLVCDTSCYGKLTTAVNKNTKFIDKIYWGALKDRRRHLIEKYLTDGYFIMTSSKAWDWAKYRLLQPADFGKPNALSYARNTVYLEDRTTPYLASRYYEALANGITPWFPVETQETLHNHLGNLLDDYIVHDPEELDFKSKKQAFDFNKFLSIEQQHLNATMNKLKEFYLS